MHTSGLAATQYRRNSKNPWHLGNQCQKSTTARPTPVAPSTGAFARYAVFGAKPRIEKRQPATLQPRSSLFLAENLCQSDGEYRVRSFAETAGLDTTTPGHVHGAPIRVLVSEPDAVSRRLICS